METTVLRMRQKTFRKAQYGLVTFFLMMAFFLYIYEKYYGENLLVHAWGAFDVEKENSFPNWFSSANLALSSLLLLVIYNQHRSDSARARFYWLLLGLIFVALSIDEVAGIHERSARIWQQVSLLLPSDGAATNSENSLTWLFQNWVLGGIIFSTVVFVVFIPFLVRLPRRTAVLFLVSGFVYVGGALGLEIVGDWMNFENISQYGDFVFNIRTLIEEAGEMYGIAIFNCTLLNIVTKGNGTLILRFGNEGNGW